MPELLENYLDPIEGPLPNLLAVQVLFLSTGFYSLPAGSLTVGTAVPFIAGGLIGIVPAIMVQKVLSDYLNTLLADKFPITNTICQWSLAIASKFLGFFIGLAVMSAFVPLVVNPFTVPMIIAAKVSATIVLGCLGFAFMEIAKQMEAYNRGKAVVESRIAQNPAFQCVSGIELEPFSLKPLEANGRNSFWESNRPAVFGRLWGLGDRERFSLDFTASASASTSASASR